MKKLILFLWLMISITSLIAENGKYGQFITVDTYNNLLQNKESFNKDNNAEGLPLVYHNTYNITFLNTSEFLVIYLDSNGNLKCLINERDYIIDNYKENDSLIMFDLYTTYVNSEEIKFEDSILLQNVNNKTFKFISKKKQFFHLKKLVCVGTPAENPLEYAELNDSKVRVRTDPNLSCDIWGYVNKNDLVIIKDRSPEKFEINGEKWYWYKVESEYLPDGWIYGKFINKISKENYEKKVKQKNKLFPEQKLSKLEIIQKISDVTSILMDDALRGKSDKNVFYSLSKKKYRNYGTSYDGNRDILEITDNRYSYKYNLKIGMNNNEIKSLLGKPDEEKSNRLIYKEKYGKLWIYTLTLYMNNDCLKKIELKKEKP